MRKDFFILSIFVGYILSFGLVRLRTFRPSAQVGAHIDHMCSCSCGEDLTITDVIIKTPDRICDWGCEWRHARKRWAGILGYFEKNRVEIWTYASPVVCSGVRARWLGQWVESWRWTNSQHSKNCFSLSSCWKPKRQEGNKSFVPEPRKSSVFRVFRIPIRINILGMWTFNTSVYMLQEYWEES